MRLRPVVVVHYHEISLKRGNRPLFLRQLARNLARAIGDLGPSTLRQRPGRIVIDLDGHPRPEAVRDRIQRVCGVASVSLGYRTSATLEAMQGLVGRLVEGRAFGSFRITARRAFKTYPLTSVELNRALGAFVLERVATRVDLEHPEVEIVVEVLPDEAFVSLDRRPGPGGLPVGASGTVNFVPSALQNDYGSRTPLGAMLILRLRPYHSAHTQSDMGRMSPQHVH